ncbi:MAG: adenylyl-sulfate kinase [Proteobacteria bacterium]|nr:adenylyl-sulfate kinase [Pseudomonadota bacterium]
MAAPARETLKIVVVGHVNHGKSTLIGRLFNDTGSLQALQAERDEGVTIDTAQIRFRTAQRDYVIIDAPGHRDFLKNMITGSASADAALLVIDAAEGVREQSRKHGYLLHLLGVGQVAVVVTKMDALGYDQGRFAEVEREIASYLSGLGVTPAFIVPVSGREGDNIAAASPNMAWYEGPNVVQTLDRFQVVTTAEDLPLRLPLQEIRSLSERRILVGRIESGILRAGDSVLFSPSNETAKVASLESRDSGAGPLVEARAGQSVGITLEDRILVERGEVVSHQEDAPIESDVFRALIFWLGGNPLRQGAKYRLKLNSRETEVSVQEIERVIDTVDLSTRETDQVVRHDVAEIVLRSRTMLALDEAKSLPRTGRFVLVEDDEIVGGGAINMEGYADQRSLVTVRATNLGRVEHQISAEDRRRRYGHDGGVLWFTGLSGAGKSTLAIEAERRLFNMGYQVYVLDGDNVRQGLNANLGFSPEDRSENIRRVGEVAALFARAGFIVLSAFISPYRSDRDRARHAAGEVFHEVFVKADLSVCERRDPKGLYRRARAGEIKDFTGISAPYEHPDTPELVVDTEVLGVEDSVERVVSYVEQNFSLKR